MISGVNHGYILLDDNIGHNYDDLDGHLNKHELGL